MDVIWATVHLFMTTPSWRITGALPLHHQPVHIVRSVISVTSAQISNRVLFLPHRTTNFVVRYIPTTHLSSTAPWECVCHVVLLHQLHTSLSQHAHTSTTRRRPTSVYTDLGELTLIFTFWQQFSCGVIFFFFFFSQRGSKLTYIFSSSEHTFDFP